VDGRSRGAASTNPLDMDVYVEVLFAGDGSNFPQAGQICRVHYTCAVARACRVTAVPVVPL
jgi:hypothetical protein